MALASPWNSKPTSVSIQTSVVSLKPTSVVSLKPTSVSIQTSVVSLKLTSVDLFQSDLEASLRARLALLLDDAYDWQEEQKEEEGSERSQHPILRTEPLKKSAVFTMPRRVFLPWMVRGWAGLAGG
jgi:hypothetical protein